MHKRPFETLGLAIVMLAVAACGSSSGSGGGGGGGTVSPPAQPVTQEEAATTANEIISAFADDGASKASFIADSKTFDEMNGSSGDCVR